MTSWHPEDFEFVADLMAGLLNGPRGKRRRVHVAELRNAALESRRMGGRSFDRRFDAALLELGLRLRLRFHAGRYLSLAPDERHTSIPTPRRTA